MRARSWAVIAGGLVSASFGAVACNLLIGNDPFPADNATADTSVPEINQPSEGGLPPLEAGACAPGYTLCNASRCVDLLGDIANCAECNRDCRALPNVTGIGVGCTGKCIIPSNGCVAGYANCTTSDWRDGCETNITQPSNCGGCANACPTAAPVCRPSGDGGYECATGCSANAPTLCVSDAGSQCVDTNKDPNNCSICGRACPGPTSGAGSATCDAGACDIACAAGYRRCEGTSVCSTQTSAQSCGPTCIDCAGGGCANGECEPTQVTTNRGTFVALAVGSGAVAWAIQSGSTVSIEACPVRGACTPTTLVTGVADLKDLAVSGSTVAWSTGPSASSAVYSCDATGCGGQPSVVSAAASGTVRCLAAADGALFYQRNSSIFQCSVPGNVCGPAVVSNGGTQIDKLGTDGLALAWTRQDAGTFQACVLSSCSTTIVAAPIQLGGHLGIAVENNEAYSQSTVSVEQLKLSTAKVVEVGSGYESAVGVHAWRGNVYVAYRGPTSADSVVRIPTRTGTTRTLNTVGKPSFLAGNGGLLFYATNGNGGSIYRLAIP